MDFFLACLHRTANGSELCFRLFFEGSSGGCVHACFLSCFHRVANSRLIPGTFSLLVFTVLRMAVNSVFVYSSRATLVVVFMLVFLLVFYRVENSCELRFRLFFEYRGLEVDIKQDMNSLVMASLCGSCCAQK